MNWQAEFVYCVDDGYLTTFKGVGALVADGFSSGISDLRPSADKPLYLGLMMSPAQLAVLRANRHLFDERFNRGLDILQQGYEEVDISYG